MKKKEKVRDLDFCKMEKVERNENKYVKVTSHFYFSYVLRIVVMFMSIIIIGIVSWIYYDASFSKVNDATLLYEESAKIDYNVKLFEDNLFENGNLNAVNNYISDVVDDISTDFSYNYTLDKESDIKYTYYVDAIMELKNNKDGSVVSRKEDNLIGKTFNTLNNSKDINIVQNVNLDYDHYNNIAKIVKDKYEMDINGNLIIKMYIDIITNNSLFDKTFNKNQVIEVKIPLLSTQVNATMVNNIDKKDFYSEVNESHLVNEGMLFVSVSLLIVDVIFLLLVLSFIFKTSSKKSKYCRIRDGLLKKYDKLIVVSKNLLDTEGSKVIECKTFSELVDAQKLVSQPIIYFELVKNQKCIFVIHSNNITYQFILKECDIDF